MAKLEPKLRTRAQHALCNMRVWGIVAPYFSEIRVGARTPRFMEVRNLSMQCVRDYWHWLKIWGLKRPCSWAYELLCIATREGVIIYVGRVSVGRRHKSLTQCRIAKLVWWGINNLRLLLYCDKALIVSYDVRRSNYWTNDKQDV